MTPVSVLIEGEAVPIGIPYNVTEREAGGWEDCTWASGVDLVNFMFAADRIPASRDSYEDLRYAGVGVREGAGQGNNLGDLERGMVALYGFAGWRIGGTWASVLARWPLGWGGALQGKYSAWPARLKASTFTGGHCECAIRTGATTFLLLDPLRANGAAAVKATAAEVGAYYSALSGAAAMIAGPGSANWRNVVLKFGLERWSVPIGTAVYENPDPAARVVTKYSRATNVTSVGIPMDNSADHINYAWRAVLVTTAGLDGVSAEKVGYVKRTALTGAASSPDWTAFVARAMIDPLFRGTGVPAPAPDTKPLTDAAFNLGRDTVVKAAESVPRRV